jgi:hypothetical protein
MKFLLISMLGISILGCHPFPRTVQVFKSAYFTLVDTTYTQLSTNIPYDSVGYYPIYYKGPLHDTINIGHGYARQQLDTKSPSFQRCNFSTVLKIFVDTSIKTAIGGRYYDLEGKYLDSICNYTAYLVTIQNTGDSAIYIGRSTALRYTYREIRNSQGDWIAVEHPLSLYCETIEPEVYLEPGEIILSKVGSYGGNVLVDCRLVMQRWGSLAYSNTFQDFVDTTQVRRINQR